MPNKVERIEDLRKVYIQVSHSSRQHIYFFYRRGNKYYRKYIDCEDIKGTVCCFGHKVVEYINNFNSDLEFYFNYEFNTMKEAKEYANKLLVINKLSC